MSNVSRRAFVGFAAAGAACLGVGGGVRLLTGEQELLRPPGGQDEAAFTARCVKCDRCRSVCPTNAVGVATVEDGLLNARTPVMSFHQGYCDFCGLCARACATGALTRGLDATNARIGVAVVQRDRCLAYDQGCTNCKDSCAYGALVFDANGHPVIDAEACNGCGRCEFDCTALVFGTFSGGTRRGVVVVPPGEYAAIGSTLVEGEGV